MARAEDIPAKVSDLARLGLLSRALPIYVTFILIAAFWIIHLPVLPVGGLSHYDEFYTLDRSISFARMGDWFTVFSGNEPSFRKPPLQYWMSAGFLEMGLGEVTSLRLPSMIFALGTLASTALLARVLAPESTWAMPLSALLLSSSSQFWLYANSAMLDMGAAFFTTIAFVGAVIAMERPRAWYFVAVVLGLGALQKAPTALPYIAAALAGLWLSQRWTSVGVRSVTLTPSFRRAAWLSLGFILIWPLLQSVKHGLDAFSESHDRQMFQRFKPDSGEGVRSLPDVLDLLIVDEPWLRWPTLAAALLLPFVVRRRTSVLVPSVLIFYSAMLFLAGGNIYSRYTLTVLPLMIAALAVILVILPPRPAAGVVLAVVLAGFSGGPVKLAMLKTAALQPPQLSAQIQVLRTVGAEIRENETLVYCRSSGSDRLIPGAVSVYGSNGRPIATSRTIPKFAENGGEVQLRGICPNFEAEELAPLLDGYSVIREDSGYVVWIAKGVK